jgi:hypothetical protein
MKMATSVLQLQALVALLVGKGKFTTATGSVVAWPPSDLATLNFPRI